MVAADLGNSTGKENILLFEEGLPGFEEVREFRLYREKQNGAVWYLQAAHADTPSFVALDPFAVVRDYAPSLTKEELAYFGVSGLSDLGFLVIAVIKSRLEDSVCNLKAPVVINVNTKRAKQIIMDNSAYPIRYQLFADKR